MVSFPKMEIPWVWKEKAKIKNPEWNFIQGSLFVGLGRFELPTSCLSSMRSKPTELKTHCGQNYKISLNLQSILFKFLFIPNAKLKIYLYGNVKKNI